MPASASLPRLPADHEAAGPGLVVMLAGTDAGSSVTAAQSGARWGHALSRLQILLAPIRHIIQELTVRLGTSPSPWSSCPTG